MVILIDFNTLWNSETTCIITNLAFVSTHYVLKLCAKTQIMRPNYALKHKLCVMRQKPNYALKSQLCIFYAFSLSYNPGRTSMCVRACVTNLLSACICFCTCMHVCVIEQARLYMSVCV